MSPARAIALGPVILDVAGIELTADDRKRLAHPMVGGMILFARNYESPSQLAQLTSDIRALRQPPLLIAVDQEGGRVSAFATGSRHCRRCASWAQSGTAIPRRRSGSRKASVMCWRPNFVPTASI